MSHIVITCTCQNPTEPCLVPGHGVVPPDPVDPQDLVDAGTEALRHLDDAVQSILKARAAWVSRGLSTTNPLPVSLDRLSETMTWNWQDLRRWVAAAKVVAEKRST